MEYYCPNSLVYIEADKLDIGENFTHGKNIDIRVRGKFSLGANSYIGDGMRINAENVSIGEYFYYLPTRGGFQEIGGGGSNLPFANLKIGDRCTIHTGGINLARPVKIGNDVGLSHEVDIITHGFWQSVLEGYPRKFASVRIGNGVIVGWKSIIMPGIEIGDNVVIGAGSVVTKNRIADTINAGNPCHYIGDIKPISFEDKSAILEEICIEFGNLMDYYDVSKWEMYVDYPVINVNKLTIDVRKFTCVGEHDMVTDAFREFLRKYGIRIFHPRGFKFVLKRK
jgi:acetyltransferase-like isoleucine patch superfamily enzyme